LWPESIKAVGAIANPRVLRALERVEMFLYRRAARIVSVTQSFRETLVRRGIDRNKIEVVTNGVDMTRFRPMPKDEELVEQLGLRDRFVAGYVGTHGMAHHLETILEAADRIRTDPEGKTFHFVLLGDGARKQALQTEAARRGLDNVTFIDSVSKEQVARYWSLLDVSIIHLRKTDLFTMVIPSKLFECMGMGIPVLHGVAGESAEIVKREGVGVVFPPEDAEALARALLALQGDPQGYTRYRERCLQAAPRYDRAARAQAMLDVVAEAVTPQPTREPG